MIEKIFKFIDTAKSFIAFISTIIDIVLDIIGVISSELEQNNGGSK